MYNLARFVAVMLAVSSVSAMVVMDGEVLSMDEAIVRAGDMYAMSEVYELVQDADTVLLELDMLFTMDTYKRMLAHMIPLGARSPLRMKRKARKSLSYRWPAQRVPYEITNSFSDSDKNLIQEVIADYHRYTCLKFVPAESSDVNRVRIVDGNKCASYVGMTGGSQSLTLGRGCRYKGIITHELGHAIGFFHEHTRPDRDEYVRIMKDNIKPGTEHNFKKYTECAVNHHQVLYDYSSVMHYSGKAFAVDTSKPTIVAIDSSQQNEMGNREGLSFKDIVIANIMYRCASVNNCAKKDCSQGFQGPDCRCWCNSGDSRNPVKKCDESGPATSRPNCEDKIQYCPDWAKAGYCTGTYVEFMTENCPYSCNRCVTDASRPARTSPALSTHTPCQDLKSYCRLLARDGLCTGRYEKYMIENCPYSCNHCDALTVQDPVPTIPGYPECVDKGRYCKSWARRGECKRNPAYMISNCKRSCDACLSYQPECRDANPSCGSLTDYCNQEEFKSYLSANCRKSCRLC